MEGPDIELSRPEPVTVTLLSMGPVEELNEIYFCDWGRSQLPW
jgi:hypothetical protein